MAVTKALAAREACDADDQIPLSATVRQRCGHSNGLVLRGLSGLPVIPGRAKSRSGP